MKIPILFAVFGFLVLACATGGQTVVGDASGGTIVVSTNGDQLANMLDKLNLPWSRAHGGIKLTDETLRALKQRASGGDRDAQIALDLIENKGSKE